MTTRRRLPAIALVLLAVAGVAAVGAVAAARPGSS